MRAQHRKDKLALVAGTLVGSLDLTIKRAGDGRLYNLKVFLEQGLGNELCVVCQRVTSPTTVAERRIPLASLFELMPRPEFSESERGLWHKLRSWCTEEIRHISRARACRLVPRYPLLQPKHQRLSCRETGPLSVVTEDGVITVLRTVVLGECSVHRVIFSVAAVPVHHVLAASVVERRMLLRVVIDHSGNFLAYPLGSPEAVFVRFLRQKLIPLGRLTAQVAAG